MAKRISMFLMTIVAIFAFYSYCDSVEAAPRRVKMGIAVSENSTWYAGAEEFAKLIKERTNGEFSVDLFPSDQLAAGSIVKGLELLRMGGTDIDMRSTIIYTTVDPKFTVPLMPWLIPSYEKADSAMGGKGGEILFDLVRNNGIEPLAFGESGFRQITNNKRPIVKPEDLVGMKIRIPTNKMFISQFKSLGADPTSINFGELFAALQQGTADGQENPPDVISSARIQEVQKYITLWNASYDPIIMGASRKFWDSLSVDEQKIFAQSAVEAMFYQKKLAREKNNELIKEFEGKMQVTHLTDEQIDAFRQAVAPVYEEYENLIGIELLEAFGYRKN